MVPIMVGIQTWQWRFPLQCTHSVWLLPFGPYHTFFFFSYSSQCKRSWIWFLEEWNEVEGWKLPQILPFAILALLPSPPTTGTRPLAHPWFQCASEWSRLGWTPGTKHEWNYSMKTEALSYGIGWPWRRGGSFPEPCCSMEIS